MSGSCEKCAYSTVLVNTKGYQKGYCCMFYFLQDGKLCTMQVYPNHSCERFKKREEE